MIITRQRNISATLVSVYFKLPTIITYERHICDSYPNNLIPQFIDDIIPEILKHLFVIADQYEKSTTSEINTIVNNSSQPISYADITSENIDVKM